jgi:hypothetical protein
MTYESPKQIRRRQQQAENKASRPRRTRTTKTFADAEWRGACEFHVGRIQEQINAGHADAAGRHAEALAHMAATRRAFEIMTSERPGFYEALRRAKVELYGEVE